nr:peptidoglycan DD-metalloendopeptidase family protein [uncultured Oscillibacter sp.]
MTFLELSLSGGVFVLAIAAFRGLTLRRLPKGTFVALWWLAAARLLLPVELASRFSVYTLLEALGPKSVPAVPDALPAPVVPAAPSVPAAPPVIAIPAQPAAVPAPAPFPVWTALWLTVGLLLAAWFLIRYVRWRRRFREALPADCPGLETWFQLRRKVEVRVTDQIAAPLTYGLFRPVILLPKTMDFKDEEALTCVLAHERAHIRRLDGLLKLALTAALCLHWFNPAVWLLYVLGNRDMELRCDEAAVLALGEDSRERYALALIRLAENRNVPLCGFAHRNGMEERIKAIMSIKKKSLLACFIALALVLGITTAFATSAKPAETDGLYNEDFTDRDLYAQSSAESAALWEETLAPYEPFGLTWTFDDPDLDGNGLTMTWEGHEVRGIYDEGKFSWITEHAGDGAFGPDAVELYTIYENGKLTGLRLATEEEQKAFDRDRRLSADSLKVETLADSVRYDSGHIYFTIPESEEPWSIFIQGRILLEDGSGQSVRYLEKESEQAEWVPQMTYSFEVADAAYDELTMDVRYGNASYCYPLTPLLPENGPLPVEPLPEGKAEIPEGAELIWPVDSGEITEPQGTRHSGVDIGAERGTPIYAAGNGTVKEAGFNAQDGNFVRLDHGSGQESFYAHCGSVLVKTGDKVTSGQTIATIGSSGMSTGPHLHFEFLVNGVATDPLVFNRANNQNNYSSQFDPFGASQGYGEGPNGDYSGKPIIAIMDGTVLDAGVKEKRSVSSILADLSGPYVEILYEDGYSMGYKACQSVLVKTGDKVKAGDVIGYTGEHASAHGPSTPQDRANDEKGRQRAEQRLVNGDYPRNSRGETYGKIMDITYTGYEPDLIGAFNGEEEGYVTKEDYYYEDTVIKDREFYAYENWRYENNISGIAFPMYDSEHNLIGEWVGSEWPGSDGKSGKTATIAEVREAQKQGFPNANGSQFIDRGPHFDTIEEAREAALNGPIF